MTYHDPDKCYAIAQEALETEGIDAYFVDPIDTDEIDYVAVLFAYLFDHPDQWDEAGEDYGWAYYGPKLRAIDANYPSWEVVD